ncbi:MAG TPA: putative metal-binding motif-containing protein, partial [bacterium]|nr:putative metal-binding motif-containing protein [bacterium]
MRVAGLCKGRYVSGCVTGVYPSDSPKGWTHTEYTCDACFGHSDECRSYVNTDPDDEKEYVTDLYKDDDGDHYGTDNSVKYGRCLSNPPTSTDTWVVDGGDCNDNKNDIDAPKMFPTNSEDCDGIDNDCDGSVDEYVKNTYYRDRDGDGYGDPDDFEDACSAPSGYVDNDNDCNDNNKYINSNTKWCYDPDGDRVCDDPADKKTQCLKPTDYSPIHEMKYPSRVDNCPNLPNPLVSDPSPYRELFAAKEDNGHKGAALNGFGYFTDNRKYFVWQPDHDLDGIGDECDIADSNGRGGFFYSRLYDVKGTPVFISVGKINSYATVRVSMPKNSGKNSEYCSGFDSARCDVAVHYCAVGYGDAVIENRWGKDGYCTTTEKTENPAYKETSTNKFTCDFGFSHGSDNYTSESVNRWRNRISLYGTGYNLDSVGDYLDLENSNEDPARKPVYAFEWLTPHKWDWIRDWYGERRCHDDDYKDTAICQSLRTAGNYNKEFTMYYSVSSSVFLDKEQPYMIKENEENKINDSYFQSENIYGRANRYGKGGDNTGILSLNYYYLNLYTVVPPVDILKYIDKVAFSSIYMNVPLQFAIEENGSVKPEVFKEYSGRWSVNKTDGKYSFDSQKIYFSDNTDTVILGEASEQSLYSVNYAVNNQGAVEYQLR